MSQSSTESGRRLPLQVIKERAATEPDREWVSIPLGTNPEAGWETLTYGQLAKAINRVADGIQAFAGVPEPDKFPTIAYIGANDSRYIAFTFAALKAGYKALFISPRNSTEGQLRLFQDTDCHFIAHTPEFQDAIDSWKKVRKMESMVVSPEKEWYTGEGSTQIDYERSVEQGEWDPFVVLHTSGSSGFPKPIICRQGWLTTMDAFNNVPPVNGVHTAQYIEYTGGDSIILPPSILADMSQVPAQVDALKKLKICTFGGGNLATRVGNYLVDQGVKLMNMISATELPYPLYFQQDHKLWQYFVFEDKLGGAEFRPTTEDPNAYQLFIKRNNLEPNLQGIFFTFPDIDEYDTKDLFRPHPTLPNHWAYAGRADTVIVFSNGEKLNPLTIEHIVGDHPGLKGALVVGQDQFQPAIILEPATYPRNDEEVEKLIDSVWPFIEEANKDSVAHGHISREFIMLTKPEKPFPRAGKGTIQRGIAVKLYKDEIEELYAKAENTQQANAPTLEVSSESELLKSLQELFTTRLDAPPVGPDIDFFTVGIDSLQVINASRLINAGLRAAGIEVDPSALAPRVIYSHPTFRELAGYLYSLVDSGSAHAGNDTEKVVQQMEDLVKKYTTDLPAANTTKPTPLDEGQTVIVTGTTGGLGSYLLHFMINDSNIKKVICLNRSKDGQGRQIQSFESRGLNADFNKVEFLQADLSLPDLGIGQTKYNELLSTTDRIIHNGWPVNFNIALSSFEPHIRGVRHFVDLSAKAAKRVPIVFISSISTVDHWKGDVPEAQITDYSVAMMNYGRSKMVSSLILDEATKVSGVPTASVRVGQIAGSRMEKGLWNKQEWFPSIVASSVYLGLLPSNLGIFDIVDWMAIEDVAHLVLEVSGVEQRLPVDKINGYFHAVNPKTTTWEKISVAVREFYGSRIKASVSFREWIDALKASQATTTDVSKNPGIKLIDSYEGFFSGSSAEPARFSMERTKSYSQTAANMEAVTPELLQNWCKQWNY
ncbi:hypothetical protein ABKA04_006739 [Annulohypoxylon sp. FPYF3050]